jgi:hypothetical protein
MIEGSRRLKNMWIRWIRIRIRSGTLVKSVNFWLFRFWICMGNPDPKHWKNGITKLP